MCNRLQIHQYCHGVLCCTNVDLSAHYEPKLSFLESFSAEIESFTFLWKLSTHVFGVLRLNHGHHESVTRLGVLGGGKSNGRDLHL
jgi:hypothetical protein